MTPLFWAVVVLGLIITWEIHGGANRVANQIYKLHRRMDETHAVLSELLDEMRKRDRF